MAEWLKSHFVTVKANLTVSPNRQSLLGGGENY